MPRWPTKTDTEAGSAGVVKSNAAGVTEKTNVSVSLAARTMPKYIVEIMRSEDKNAVDPVFVGNGDYQVTIKRGVPVVVPEAIVTVLEDAKTGIQDPITKSFTDVPSYPFSARPYDGPEPIGTVMSMQTMRPAVPH